MATKGFTLLEILIAMAIFTMIGLASYSVLTTTTDSNSISKQRIAKLEALQRTMLYMERDILQAVPRAVRVAGEANGKVISGGRDQIESEADGLALVRTGWQNPLLMLPRSTLQAVGYRLQEGQLQRLYTLRPDNVIGAEPKVVVLLDDVQDFSVQFLIDNKDNNNRTLDWQDDYIGSVLPRAIAVEIDSLDFGLIRREFLLASEGANPNAAI